MTSKLLSIVFLFIATSLFYQPAIAEVRYSDLLFQQAQDLICAVQSNRQDEGDEDQEEEDEEPDCD